MNNLHLADTNSKVFKLGIDIGSISAKAVILDPDGELCFSDYRRHRADTRATLSTVLEKSLQTMGNLPVLPMTTGSAGMGFSERYRLPFIQEVIASTQVVQTGYEQVTTLFDIGGEDAKMIFFEKGGAPDIRMNGSCAGGTGAYIDEMASLLNVSLEELNALAERHTRIHSIASRCGVFGKTDVQNLLARAVAHEDIAASILYAVVFQVLATLARGLDLKPKYMFSGGPLTFLPALRSAFMDVLKLEPEDVLEAPHMELLPAWGAALSANGASPRLCISDLLEMLQDRALSIVTPTDRLKPLFAGNQEWEQWKHSRSRHQIERVSLQQVEEQPCFLGIDSGSTTSKIVLIDQQGRVVFSRYRHNRGNALRTVQEELEDLGDQFTSCQHPPRIEGSAATGYGEDLVRTAFALDEGIVETLAHYQAAKAFDPQVSFILDIGGQDMKAIFVREGTIYNLEINEACSSGCGTFIETLAGSLGYGVEEFSEKACLSSSPCDLGSRCTVFMNSKIKQSLKEAAGVEDISAGLAYSVIKNSLYKVLRISNSDVLGEHIIVQGGTFRNPAVHRAFENLTGKEVVCPDMAELMGAYGAALAALESWKHRGRQPGKGFDFERLKSASQYQQRSIGCRGCENRCTVTKLAFSNGGIFYTGNRCERIYSNHGKRHIPGTNLVAQKLNLLFDRKLVREAGPAVKIGIPRVLNIYENFPFWCTLLVECGFEVVLSDPSSQELFKKGTSTVMSENICFPAKLAHGHLENLIEKGVDRILYPMVFAESTKFTDAINSFNCPIVTGYPDVLKNAIDPQGKHDIPLDMPTVNLNDEKLLWKACSQYLRERGIKPREIRRAFDLALGEQRHFKESVRQAGAEIIKKAQDEDRLVILLLGKTYHLDPLINHGIPQILIDLGVDVITEDAVPLEEPTTLNNRNLPTQWEQVNRQIYAAQWACRQAGVQIVHLNSFACGPDAYSMEEIKSILHAGGKSYTAVRIDEVESMGSTRLRLRSLVETLRAKERVQPSGKPRSKLKIYEDEDRHKIILTPYFSQFVAPIISGSFSQMGYQVHTLPPPDRESVEIGLRYAQNEICYPGIIIIGDIIKALKSGEYDLSQVAAASWQTGGQCRATSILSMLRRALISAGFPQIPIVALSTSSKLHEQPGFRMSWLKFVPLAFKAAIFSDAISSMYHASAVREIHPGQSKTLAEELMAPLASGEMPLDRETILARLRNAAALFNEIPTHTRTYPKVGIVGEIYVKFNPFSNFHVADWLTNQGLEVVLPSFLEFFLGWFVSNHIRVKHNLQHYAPYILLADWVEKRVQSMLDQVEYILQGYKHHHPRHTIHDVAAEAKKIVSLTHAYGEGWLIAGEVGLLAHQGVPNVLCLQPFGCIANQVVARGAAKKLKGEHSFLNMLFLDLDAGVSEVNHLNRLHFFASQAKAAFNS